MELIEAIDERGVAFLTLNRPYRRNALDGALVADLTMKLLRLERDPDVRIVVISGAGGNFCAGGDIEWMCRMARLSSEENAEDARTLGTLFETLDGLSKPTLALVQGAAFGGGVGLVACCDIVVSAKNAKFSLSEVRLGLVPAVVAPYVVRAIGVRQSRALFLSAEIVGADCAFHLGLVHEVALDSALASVRDRFIEALLLGAPGAQADAKRVVGSCVNRRLDASLKNEMAELLAARRASPEGAAGLAGFLEKQAPDWRSLRGS